MKILANVVIVLNFAVAVFVVAGRNTKRFVSRAIHK